MSYESLLTHRCNVYHLTQTAGSGKFGIPAEDLQKDSSYPPQADLTDVPCRFITKNQSITQGEPNNVIVETFKVHFLIDADVRINDKVVWEGTEYYLQKPNSINNHHIEVEAIRSGSL